MKSISELITELQETMDLHGDLIVAIDGEVYTPEISVEKAGYVCDETNMPLGVGATIEILNIV